MVKRIDIKPDILLWAIERADYDLPKMEGVYPKAVDWIKMKKKPTLNQLKDFAKKVHVPFGYLLLDQPPKEEVPIPFFRTVKESNKLALNVYDTILSLQQRQDWLSGYLKDEGNDELGFVGKYNLNNKNEEIIADIRQVLELNNNWQKQYSTWKDALNALMNKIYEAGIITVFNSIVDNNTRRNIRVEDCRGFVLVDKYAPFLFVNSADTKAAQMFTLIHELAYIWLGKSAGFDFRNMQPANDALEQKCDQIAAEFLVPEEKILEKWEDENDFERLAKTFKVSPVVIARRAWDLNKISRNEFFAFFNAYMEKFRKSREKSGGGDFFNTYKQRINPKFAAYVNRATKEDKLLYRDAYRLMRVKGETYHRFVGEYL